MNIRKFFTILTVILFGFSLYGEEVRKDSIIVSLVTCSPGSEIYELCGHEAVRVRGVVDGVPLDSVWNYGIFDFAEPNFVYRFVKGETDYRLAGYPFAYFLPEYAAAGRQVFEQDLNLTQNEARRMLGLLREESRPENCRYRYNYVKDNCATRITWRLDSAVSSRIVYPDDVRYGTFRDEMRAYHANYPWYQFGIDLALGSGLDRKIRGRDEMFVPVEMMLKASDAHLADGRKLVAASRVLIEKRGEPVLSPTPWYLTPLAVGVYALVIALVVSLWEARRKRILKVVNAIWFGICGIAGCVVFFLVFFSEHEATSPNLVLIWLNPLQLLMAVCVLSRKLRYGALAMSIYNITVLGCLLIVWFFQAQSANPAFFPLMGATLALAIAYAYVETQKKKNNEKNTDYGAVRSRYDKRGVSVKPRSCGSSKARGGNRR